MSKGPEDERTKTGAVEEGANRGNGYASDE